MNEAPSAEAAASNLCTKCGLCCNGVLFDWVPVAADEEQRLRGLGFVLDPNEEGLRFAQPCPKFECGLCQVYGDRPRPCRRFRCKLLQKLEGGDIGLAEAEAIVAQAKELIEEVRPSLQPQSDVVSVGNFWGRLFKRWQAGSPRQRAEQGTAALVLKLTVLNRFLERHFFRSEGKRRIMEEQVSGPGAEADGRGGAP